MTATLSATVQLVSAAPAAAAGRAHGRRGGTCAGPATTSRCLVCAAPKINSIHHPTAAFPLLGNSDVAVSWEVRVGGPHQPSPR